jgi:hypothetical protein
VEIENAVAASHDNLSIANVIDRSVFVSAESAGDRTSLAEEAQSVGLIANGRERRGAALRSRGR